MSQLPEWLTKRRSAETEETFTVAQICASIRCYLKYGEDTFGSGHQGVFSGNGWDARCLRFHMSRLEKQGRVDEILREIDAACMGLDLRAAGTIIDGVRELVKLLGKPPQ